LRQDFSAGTFGSFPSGIPGFAGKTLDAQQVVAGRHLGALRPEP
jgi:hypothetical protein